jgi:hypothetical protein
VYRVRATVRNLGLQPTELAIRQQQRTAVPVRVSLEPAAGVQLLSSDARQDIAILSGYEEERVEWLVRAPRGGTVAVRAVHPKAGAAAATAQLGP